jgi:excisionase family DNA binding protein
MEYLKISRDTVYEYSRRGWLPYYELPGGKGRRFKKADLDGVLQKRDRKPKPD